MVLVQKWQFFQLFFLGNIGQENVYYDILERKNAFLSYKNSIFKKWKNCDICKGVNTWFLSKIGYFSIFLFLSISGQENVFHDILQRKNGLLGFKNKKFKKSKNWDICKGVNPWFRSKLAFFPSFFFLSIIGEDNVFYDILERKHAFLKNKNSIIKKWKNWDFCKGANPWFWSKIGYFSIFFS